MTLQQLRPNQTLHPNEKCHKLYLKRLLKEQHVLYKYGMRYQQAVRRNDMMVAISSLRDIRHIEEQVKQQYGEYQSNSKNSNKPTATTTTTMIHYKHILNDPFVTENFVCRNIIEDVAFTGTSGDGTSSSIVEAALKQHQPLPLRKNHNERLYIERFYHQLHQQLLVVSSSTSALSSSDTSNNNNNNNHHHHHHREDDQKATTSIPDNDRYESEDVNDTATGNGQKVHYTYNVARELLRNMTKGTQELVEFNNYHALLGYTRHKFIERAMLVVSSLHHILNTTITVPTVSGTISQNHHASTANKKTNDEMSQQQQQLQLHKWKERLLSIRTVTAIGCGPGCDAVGVVAALLQHKQHQHQRSKLPRPNNQTPTTGNISDETKEDDINNSLENINVQDDNNSINCHIGEGDTCNFTTEQTCLLDRVVLLDWAMEQWYYPIVQSVSNLLLTQQCVRSIVCQTCDVRKSISEQQQEEEPFFTRTMQYDWTDNHSNSNTSVDSQHEEVEDDVDTTQPWLTDTDLVVVSYLFSETRNAWQNYFDDYIRLYCKVGTIFLITDPTAWQLHIFRDRYEYASDDQNAEPGKRHENICNPNTMTLRRDDDQPSCPDFHTFDTDDDYGISTRATYEERRPAPQQRRVLMEFQWLDSSMYRPELQELEGRNGPGALLAMKVAN